MTPDPVLGDLAPEQVRVRFPPSPTGNLHIGNVRSALYNWVFARHHGGTFVLRIEDTDAERNLAESYRNIYDSLSWLGLDWDEGPERGGEYGPYLQSERRGTHDDIAARLLEAGLAYKCFDTPAELEARQKDRPKGAPQGYDGIHRNLTPEQVAEFEAQGKPYVIRMKTPESGAITFTDLVRGEVSFDAAHQQDYVIVRANGNPLYTLVNPVDDALMGITHVLRGEDLLPSTPRQIVLYRALAEIGVGSGRIPIFGHLPTVLGEGNKRLSKRDQGGGLAEYQEKGYLPEGLLNYLALLGWGIADDRDVFTIDEMVKAFDIRKVNASPARFDPKKCEAINAEHIRLLTPEAFVEHLTGFLGRAGVIGDPATDAEQKLITDVAPLIQERINTLSDSVAMIDFLFATDDKIVIADDAGLKPDSAPVLDATIAALSGLATFDHEAIEAALRAALVDGLGLKPRHAFGPVRAAVTGKRISPPLFESLELLGRESTLARLTAARAGLGG
ncbi:glutamate--tRNA ligase [Microlunatus sp. GCM10028923]|uniref:glutamate--tRNA ligase n=1 Tax=Microlunatus sp. GCM10028923 TaxID=3273400 RepID=UPI00361695FA